MYRSGMENTSQTFTDAALRELFEADYRESSIDDLPPNELNHMKVDALLADPGRYFQVAREVSYQHAEVQVQQELAKRLEADRQARWEHSPVRKALGWLGIHRFDVR